MVTLDDGQLEVRTNHQSWPSWTPPRSAPVPVPRAPHLVPGVAKDASLEVIQDAYKLLLRLYGASGELLSDKQRARAERRMEAIRAAFAALS